MMNWSEYEEEKFEERNFWRQVAFAIFIGFAGAMILGPLFGCASVTKEETQVCFLKYLGGTESGLSVVRSLCMTEAQFAEMQK